MDAVTVIDTEARRFAAVLADTPPAARCPTCPEWNADDLLWHLTEVHLFWGAILATGATTDAAVEQIEAAKPARPADTAGLLELRASATAALLAQLSALPDDEPRWTWWDADQTVGFTRRMQTHEATMHRVDAELTAGLPISPIATNVATAGVSHCIDVMWGWLPDWATHTQAAVVALEATDTDWRRLLEVGRWTGTGPESGNSFDEPIGRPAASDAEPTATVRGTAQDLDLWAWTRGGEVELTGDDTALAAMNALVANGHE
ncbi:maleylpyruvate isomerase N-terminal domain-containing protein [Propionibacteriaceae bacterium Y2011]